MVIFQQSVHREQEFHLRRVETNAIKWKSKFTGRVASIVSIILLRSYNRALILKSAQESASCDY